MAESTAYAAPLWQDYLELTKPRVVALMILTAVIGMCMAVPGLVPWQPLVFGNLGIALCAGAAAAINHIVDERIDQQMARTQARPVATGRISQQDATLFAFALATLGVTVLVLWVNVLTAVLTVASLIGYAFVYTMYLKRATPQNIVIGGLAGAAPPLLGWTAVTGELHGHALLLVLIIFAWTPPHFWALAIHRRDEYASVGIPMLPVTHGTRFALRSVYTRWPGLTDSAGLSRLARNTLRTSGSRLALRSGGPRLADTCKVLWPYVAPFVVKQEDPIDGDARRVDITDDVERYGRDA